MPIYIVRPRFMAGEVLSLATRSMARVSRQAQLKELGDARVSDKRSLEVKRLLRATAGAKLLTTSERATPVTGTTIVDMPDGEADRLRRELPDTLVLRDQPIGLIEPRRGAAVASKKKLGASDLWHLKVVGLEAARKKKFKGTGKGVTVAVLDTGIDATHPEVAHAVKGAFTFDTATWQARPFVPSRDTDGHGTHVAGLIAGKKVGVAPGAALLSGVMLPQGHGNLSDFVLALEWCASQPEVQIVNMSAGIPGYLDGMHAVVADLLAVGVLPVIATGNEGRNRTRSPGNYTEVLSVGAVNRQKKVSSFSSGAYMVADSHQYHVPDLVAPGEGVYSSVMGGGYEAWDGTSMATPVVSGIAALILARHPNITLAQLEDELLTTCQDLKAAPDRQGKGLVQVKAAV